MNTSVATPIRTVWVKPTVRYADPSLHDKYLAINETLIASLKIVDGQPQYTYTPPVGYTRIITLISEPHEAPRFEINTRFPPHLDPHYVRCCYSMIGLIQELYNIDDFYRYNE